MASLEKLVVPTLNHLLQSEIWAQERLRPFSGAHLCIVAGPFTINLLINEQGLFSQTTNTPPADVTLTLPDDAPFKFFLDRDALLASIKLSGSVNLAESLAFVFRNLDWDFESDLASIVGDIPARRLSMTITHGGRHILESIRRISSNFTEFATEDANLITANYDLESFGHSVNILRDDIARLEKRIDQL